MPPSALQWQPSLCYPHPATHRILRVAENGLLSAAVSTQTRSVPPPSIPWLCPANPGHPHCPGQGRGSQGAVLGGTAHPSTRGSRASPPIAAATPPRPGGPAPALPCWRGPPALAGVQPGSDAEECGGAAGDGGPAGGAGDPPPAPHHGSSAVGLTPWGPPVPSHHGGRSPLAGFSALQGGITLRAPIAMGPAPTSTSSHSCGACPRAGSLPSRASSLCPTAQGPHPKPRMALGLQPPLMPHSWWHSLGTNIWT